MSSELLCTEDSKGASISLEMKTNGMAILTIFGGPNQADEQGEELMIDFYLYPDSNDVAKAEEIEKSLRTWREHVSNLNTKS